MTGDHRAMPTACIQAGCASIEHAARLASMIGQARPEAVVHSDGDVVEVLVPGMDDDTAWGLVAGLVTSGMLGNTDPRI